jgi:molybdopterin-containing oxidoreductase family iron-sulfur binding subunit
MTKYAMVVDLDRCQGCRACMEACKIENNTMQSNFWMYVFRFE